MLSANFDPNKMGYYGSQAWDHSAKGAVPPVTLQCDEYHTDCQFVVNSENKRPIGGKRDLLRQIGNQNGLQRVALGLKSDPNLALAFA
jgi:hypothetical protein